MKKRLPFFTLDNEMIDRVQQGERYLLHDRNGEVLAAVVSPEDLDILEGYDRFEEEQIDKAMKELDGEKPLDWDS